MIAALCCVMHACTMATFEVFEVVTQKGASVLNQDVIGRWCRCDHTSSMNACNLQSRTHATIWCLAVSDTLQLHNLVQSIKWSRLSRPHDSVHSSTDATFCCVHIGSLCCSRCVASLDNIN